MGVLSLDAHKASVTVSEQDFEIFHSEEGPILQSLIVYHMSSLCFQFL